MSVIRDELAATIPTVLLEYFGDSVIYSPVIGSPATITAIVGKPPVAEQAYPGVHCFAKCLKSDLPDGGTRGSKVRIGVSNYIVDDISDNAIGMTKLFLKRDRSV